jgi:hypothetical protein
MQQQRPQRSAASSRTEQKNNPCLPTRRQLPRTRSNQHPSDQPPNREAKPSEVVKAVYRRHRNRAGSLKETPPRRARRLWCRRHPSRDGQGFHPETHAAGMLLQHDAPNGKSDVGGRHRHATGLRSWRKLSLGASQSRHTRTTMVHPRHRGDRPSRSTPPLHSHAPLPKLRPSAAPTRSPTQTPPGTVPVDARARRNSPPPCLHLLAPYRASKRSSLRLRTVADAPGVDARPAPCRSTRPSRSRPPPHLHRWQWHHSSRLVAPRSRPLSRTPHVPATPLPSPTLARMPPGGAQGPRGHRADAAWGVPDPAAGKPDLQPTSPRRHHHGRWRKLAQLLRQGNRASKTKTPPPPPSWRPARAPGRPLRRRQGKGREGGGTRRKGARRRPSCPSGSDRAARGVGFPVDTG